MTNKSDGSTAKYYELPIGATELQHLISFKDMNGQMAEIFRAVYRYGEVEHSPKLRDAKKILYYITAEIERLESYAQTNTHKSTSDKIEPEVYCPRCKDQPNSCDNRQDVQRECIRPRS